MRGTWVRITLFDTFAKRIIKCLLSSFSLADCTDFFSILYSLVTVVITSLQEATTAPFFFYCNILHKFTYPQLKLLTNTENKIHVNLKSRKSHLNYITDVFLVFAFTIILVTKH